MLYHRLALQMGRTVEEFLESVSSEELTRWVAFSRLAPWGDERADYQAATIALTVYQMLRGKNSPTLKLDDFVLKFEGESEPKDLRALLMGYTAAAGGKIKAGK